MASRVVRGVYVNGSNHSPLRPKFYKSMGLWQGSINIRLPAEIDESLIIPKKRVEGLDPIDADQYFLIRPCKLKDRRGFQILPVKKSTGDLQGHHAEGVIEIALTEKIELTANEQLEVELEDFDD